MNKVRVKLVAGLIAAIATGSFVGCGSTSQTPQQMAIEWKGSSVGATEPAAWLKPALSNDIDSLPSSIKDRIEGKHFVIIETRRVRKDDQSTKDLRLAQELANSQYMADIARTLNAAVISTFSGTVSEREEAQKTINSAAASARFSGFEKIADSWVLNRVKDNDKKIITDTYTVVQIYACEQNLWKEQAANYIREVCGKSESEDMKKAAARADELVEMIKPGKTE